MYNTNSSNTKQQIDRLQKITGKAKLYNITDEKETWCRKAQMLKSKKYKTKSKKFVDNQKVKSQKSEVEKSKSKVKKSTDRSRKVKSQKVKIDDGVLEEIHHV